MSKIRLYWKLAALCLTVLFAMLVIFDLARSVGATCPQQQSASAPQHGENAKPKECGISESATYATARAFIHFVESSEKFFVAFGTIVIAAFTIVLGIATAFLWKATRDLVKGADANAERQLRAYVVIDTCQAVAGPRPGDFGEEKQRLAAGSYAIAIVNYKNTGQTPAYDVRIDGEAELRPWPLEEAELTPSHPTTEDSQAVLGRDGSREVHVKELSLAPLIAPRMEELEQGRRAFVVWGRITYRDIFGKNWHTDFRYFIGGVRGVPSIGMSAHNRGNDAT